MEKSKTVQFNTPESAPSREPLLKSVFQGSFLKEVLLPAITIIVVVLAGVGTGWVLSKGETKTKTPQEGTAAAPGAKVTEGGKIVGLEDESTFRDIAEGTLEEGGIDGEGTHHLVRDGGPSQYVYMTSSVVDLDQFAGKKVQVWGETIGAEKAGWLMDVGRLKVLE